MTVCYCVNNLKVVQYWLMYMYVKILVKHLTCQILHIMLTDKKRRVSIDLKILSQFEIKINLFVFVIFLSKSGS